MPEANQFTWSHQELLEMLIKQSGVNEGRWMLMVQFNVGPGNFGPTDDEIIPGMIVGVAKIGMQRAEDNSPPRLVLDASKVNPQAVSKKIRKTEKRE